MPVILIFPQQAGYLSIVDINDAMMENLGVPCGLLANGEVAAATDDEFLTGQIRVEIPELEEDEGEPIVDYEAAPRTERDEAFQAMIDEILRQEKSLAPALNRNAYDIVLSFDDTAAAVESGSALAYAIATETDSGLLVIGGEDEEASTVWFSNAEEFADLVFGDDEDEEYEELENSEEDAEEEK